MAERGGIELNVGAAEFAPDYRSTPITPFQPGSNPSEPGTPTYLLSREEVAIVGLLKSLRPGQELRVLRDELGGPLGYKVYDVIGADT